MQIRIATWNLERPGDGQSERTRKIRELIHRIDADIWILTETNESVTPGDDYTQVASSRVRGLHRSGEHWTTVWSRYPVSKVLSTHAPEIAVCAEVQSPAGPFVVYGTVLPYHADRVASHGYRNWQAHYESIPQHGADWRQLRDEYPTHLFCVAGDFNQSRDTRRWNGRLWYGTQPGRAMLTDALVDSGLACVTEEDFVSTGKLATRSSIDHICIDVEHQGDVLRVDAWEAIHPDGSTLSDHNGVFVDLAVT